jgi:hypothetical protein
MGNLLMTRSQLFHTYNLARSAARKGKLEPCRTNRALGILMSKDAEQHLAKYGATINKCNCQDAQHGNVCKHRIARMIERRTQ